MTSFIVRPKLALTVTLLVPCTAALWLVAVGGTMTASTYAMLAALLAAMAAVAVKTWRNSQATSSMGQLLHETELTPSRRSAVREGQTGAKRKA